MATRLSASRPMSMSPSRSSSMAARLRLRPQQRQRRLDGVSVKHIVEPWPILRRLVREPGVLALCISPCRLLTRSDGCLANDVTLKPEGNFANADRAHDGQARSELAINQGLHFFSGSTFDHVRKALVAAAVEPFARWKEDQRSELDPTSDPTFSMFLPLRQCLSRSERHFQRSGNSGRVSRVEACRCLRIQNLQFFQI